MSNLQPVSSLGGLAPNAAANTAAASGAWIDVRQVIGDIRVIVDVGVVTAGTITPTIEDADDITGSNNAAVTPLDGAFTAVTTSNDPLRQVKHVSANAIRGFVRFVGTVVTGPAQVSATIEGRLKYQ